jgi:hypothetical protein
MLTNDRTTNLAHEFVVQERVSVRVENILHDVFLRHLFALVIGQGDERQCLHFLRESNAM